MTLPTIHRPQPKPKRSWRPVIKEATLWTIGAVVFLAFATGWAGLDDVVDVAVALWELAVAIAIFGGILWVVIFTHGPIKTPLGGKLFNWLGLTVLMCTAIAAVGVLVS